MSSSREEVAQIARAVGYTIPESELDDYAILLGKARAAFEEVLAMDGSYLSEPMSRLLSFDPCN